MRTNRVSFYLFCFLVMAVTELGWNMPYARGQLSVILEDYATMPMTGNPTTMAGNVSYLARVNFLEDEPGNPGRFFVNDLNGPLYTLDKTTKQFNTYLNFNGRGSGSGMFDKFTFASGLANGLVTFEFDPGYDDINSPGFGKFYTVHLEEPNVGGSLIPSNANQPGLNTSGYTATTAISSPGFGGMGSNPRHSVLIEWSDTNIANNSFEGTARELLRLEEFNTTHPIGDLTFNPVAQPGDADWRVMYIASGDGQAGEQTGSTGAITRTSPLRLDSMAGKILRIIPDLGEHVESSTVSSNGRYRIPDDNPFVDVSGALGEVYALGFRNPHRLTWGIDPDNLSNNRLMTNDIGFNTWEEVNIVLSGGNYGWSYREGNQQVSTSNAISALPSNDTVPIFVGSTNQGSVTPTYPVVQYGHGLAGQSTEVFGDAISDGFVYQGSAIPALTGKYIFGDITTGKLWYADYNEMLAADDGNPNTMAAIHEIHILWDSPFDSPNDGEEVYDSMSPIVFAAYKERGGIQNQLPGYGTIRRADIRLTVDASGELYIMSKSDGMIRALVGPTPLPGDFDGNGTVDLLDLAAWQIGYGIAGTADISDGDADQDGDVDGQDFLIWQRNVHAGSNDTSLLSVPEPASSIISLMSAALLLLKRKR